MSGGGREGFLALGTADGNIRVEATLTGPMAKEVWHAGTFGGLGQAWAWPEIKGRLVRSATSQNDGLLRPMANDRCPFSASEVARFEIF